MQVKFPLEVDANKNLVVVDGPEAALSQILLLISTTINELPHDPDLGVPYRLFETRSRIDPDLAYLNTQIVNHIEDVSATVSGELLESGLLDVRITWEYNGTVQPNLTFRVAT